MTDKDFEMLAMKELFDSQSRDIKNIQILASLILDALENSVLIKSEGKVYICNLKKSKVVH